MTTNDDDPLRGTDLPPVPPTARPAVPVGKHSVPTGPLVDPWDTPLPLTQQPGDPRTAAELQAQTLSDDAHALANEVVAMRRTADALARRTTNTRLIVAALAVLIAIGGWVLYRQAATTNLVERITACQAHQNDAFRAVSAQLRDAAAKERTAQRQLLETSLNPNTTTADRRAATQVYLNGLAAADQQRAENPYPTGNCS